MPAAGQPAGSPLAAADSWLAGFATLRSPPAALERPAPRVAVVTDSAAALPAEWVKAFPPTAA